MDSKMEQLKEDYNEEEQLETSKKRPKKIQNLAKSSFL